MIYSCTAAICYLVFMSSFSSAVVGDACPCIAFVATEWVALSKLSQQRYTSAGWFSYKTINTALIAGMGLACQRFAEKLSVSSQT